MTASYDEASDRAFARFVRTRDPDDLAAVFDAVAPRLALVAQQLVGDPHAAEDLVQTTFLEALRAVDRFEPGRPVRPWLTTILTRRAANELRRRRRHGMPGDDVMGGDGDHPADPVQHAVDAELVERVEAALAALPTEQRQALTLRLLHGLRPVDIARALERPLGTYAQLHRGLAALRGRLPAGLLTLWAAMLGDEARAAARESILTAARQAGRAGGPWVGVGGLRLLGTLLVLAMLVGSGWVWWEGARGPAGAPSGAVAAADPGSAMAAAEQVDAAGFARAARRTSVSGAGSAPSVEGGPRATLRGRIVGSEDQGPLAEATVTLRHADDSRSTRTDAAGRFVVDCSVATASGVRLEATAGVERIAAFADLPALAPGADLDLGDLPLAPAAQVRLRATVRGRDEPPPAGLRLGLLRDEPGAHRWILDRAWRPLVDGDPGPVALDAEGRTPWLLVAPGRWRVVRFDSTGGRIEAGPLAVVADGVRREHPVEVVLPEATEAVTGQVVDGEGRPLAAGTPVVLETVADGATSQQELDDRGRFRFGPFDATQAAQGFRVVRVGVGPADTSGTAWVVQQITPGPLLSPGTPARVRVERTPPATWTLVVRGADHVRWGLTPTAASPAGEWCASAGPGSLGDGSVDVLEITHPGAHWLSVTPTGASDTALVGMPTRFTSGAPTVTTVDLGATTGWRIEVVDEHGAPVEGARVDLLRRLGDLEGMPASEVALDALFARGLEPPVVDVVGPGATTGADGCAVLTTHAWLGEAARLRVRSARHLSQDVALPERSRPTETRRLVLREARVWRGRVAPLDVLEAWTATPAERAFLAGFADGAARLAERRPFLALRGADGDDVARVRIDAEGRFASGPLAAHGGHVVELVLGLSSGASGRVEQRVPLARWPSPDQPADREVRYDLGGLRPARLRGRLFVDGQAWASGAVRVAAESLDAPHAVDAAAPGYACEVSSDEDGRFAVPGPLLPGRYRIAAVRAGSGFDSLVWSDVAVALGPGADLEHEARAVTRAWSVRVVTAAGEPATGRRVAWRVAPTGDPLRGRSVAIGLPVVVDAAGVVRIAPLPVPARAPLGIELLVIDDGADPGSIDLVLGRGGVTAHGPFPVDGAAPTLRLGDGSR